MAVGCGHRDDTKSAAAACDALAIAAAEAHAIRDQVALQYQTVDRAMDKADQLQHAADAGTDTPAGAMQRAFAAKRSGFALCQAAALVDQGMLELARRHANPEDVRSAEAQLARVSCQLKAQVDGAKDARRAAADEWSSRSRDAHELEERLVQPCFEKSGAQRPEFHLSPILLPTE